MLRDDEADLDGRLEEVHIESVSVGDYLYIPATKPSPRDTHCVLLKVSKPDKVPGWQLALANGGSVWLPRRAKVKRRKFDW